MDKITNNEGIATVMAIGIMVFIVSIAIAVIPNINNMLRQSIISADMLRAQSAAETGAKRAIAELYQGKGQQISYDWTWLNKDNSPQKNNNQNGNYHVVISGSTNLIGTTKPSAGTYNVTSTGTFANRTSTVRCTVNIGNRKNTFQFLAYSPNEIKVGAISVGDICSRDSISINLLSVTGALFNGKSNLYTPGGKNISISLIAQIFSYSKKDANTLFGNNLGNYPTVRRFSDSFFEKYETMPGLQVATLYHYIDPGKYVVNGDLDILFLNALNLSREGCATIHVRGDLNLGILSRIGNIVDGVFTSENKNFLIIVDGDVNISSKAGINNAVIISYGKVNIGNMVNISGSIQAVDGIYASQELFDITPVTLLYNEKAVAPFLQYASVVNYGTDETFKVSNWR